MANKHNGEVSLVIGSKTYVLKLTHNKAANAEPYLGTSIFNVVGKGVSFIRALLYVMTVGQHGIETIDDAGDLLDDDPVAITRAVSEATSFFFQMYSKETTSKVQSS